MYTKHCFTLFSLMLNKVGPMLTRRNSTKFLTPKNQSVESACLRKQYKLVVLRHKRRKIGSGQGQISSSNKVSNAPKIIYEFLKCQLRAYGSILKT